MGEKQSRHGARHGARDGEGHGGRSGRRQKRPFDYGDLRLMALALMSDQPRHGYELIKLIEARFDGAYAPSPGAIYPTLAWLEDMGFVSMESDQGRRRQASITEAGRTFLDANKDTVASIWDRKGPADYRRRAPEGVVRAMDGLKAAIRARLGDTPQTADIEGLVAMINALSREISVHAGPRITEGAAPDASSANAVSGAEDDVIITRHRFETRRRTLSVREVQNLTPHMIRVLLEGEDLADFISLGADDHIKLFFSGTGSKPLMRDYTPRAYDTAAGTLTLDFAVHQAGPATDWAINARSGDRLEIGGPRGSSVIAPVFDWWLLIGDETALPAIGRRAEELPAGTQVITLAAVPSPEDEQVFETQAAVESHWVHRPVTEAADPETLLARLAGLTLPQGRGFVWIAAEAGVARALRDHIREDRGHPGAWTKASGYWVNGSAAGDASKGV